MHPFFSVTLFTGQQLVLEALQRWLQRPCPDAASAARRRMGLKQLIGLLLRTAATGVLATVLDAAIEFRRRQLLAAAAAEPEGAEGGASGALARLPGLGMLSRAGVAAWKSRLLLAIDELERRAGAYGIESRHRFSPGKDEASPSSAAAAAGSSSSSGKAALPRHLAASCADLSGAAGPEECSPDLGRTVECLQELVKQGDAESQRRLDAEVGSLVDLILGTTPPHTPTLASSAAAASAAAGPSSASRSRSVPAALDGMWRQPAGASAAAPPCSHQPGSPPCGGSGSAAEEPCAICMDRPVTVAVTGCSHNLCFGCARRLCAAQDHLLPQCPFCRQAIEGFVALRPAAQAAA